MINRAEMAEGLGLLADAMGVRLTETRIDAYHSVLARRFRNAAEWRATVARAAEECERFPVPKVLLALRPPGAVEGHRCELCEQTPGFVYGCKLKARPHLVPCPRRNDQRAAEWYAEKAEERGSTVMSERAAAEASGLALSREEAKRIMGRLDPDGTAFGWGKVEATP